MNAAAPICSYEGCKVQIDGNCALGRDPVESCENYAVDIEPAEELEDPEEPKIVPPVKIWASNKMLLADYSALSKRRRLRTVALVGEEKVGKTTLLCSIYAMFCKGPFAGLTFAGSETLLGFAKLQAFAMLNSGRASPTVPRTSRRDPLAFFHLALARSRRNVVDLVIADRSGETYAAARTSTDLIGTLEEFKLAERVCFLLDGGRLASKDDRTAYTRNFRQMINALQDNGALARVGAIEILSTKLDITRGSDPADVGFLSDFQARTVSDFAKKGLIISSHEICALPKANRTVGIVGLDGLIRRWTEPPSLPDVTPRPVADAPRQIDRLLSKIRGSS
jgi:Double-GTPase 2